jgi:hypothetical protein
MIENRIIRHSRKGWEKEMRYSLKSRLEKKIQGQSMVEIAIILPVLLMLITSLTEFGFGLLEYLGIQDAVRNAARYASDGAYNYRDNNMSCDPNTGTKDFYRTTACLVNQELRQERPLVHLNDNGTPGDYTDDYLDPAHGDDIIVSAFGILEDTGVSARFPTEYGDQGWSYALDLGTHGFGPPTRNAVSAFSSAQVNTYWLNTDTNYGYHTPSTGIVIVEVFYHYDQKLKLPWITAFVPDPLPLHFATIMSLSSAEPTPTPEP